MIKEFFKKIQLVVIIKRFVRAFIQISINYLYDCKNYIKHSSSINFTNNKSKIEGRICVFYHALEKGMSLPKPKDGFGEQKALDLMEFTLDYIKFPSYNAELVATVSGVLDNYFEQSKNYKNVTLISKYEYYSQCIKISKSTDAGLSKAYKSNLEFNDYSTFVKSRRSIRDFNSNIIQRSKIEECISLARYTPSVCNRQPWKIYIYEGKEQVTKALSLQHGNRGFCEELNSLVLVTVDRAKFWHALERNQAYIDGGMFSMSIVNAFHAAGLGSCCLNMSLTAKQETILKTTLDINHSEIPIMMITVSDYNDGAKVAASERLPLQYFLGN